MDHAVLNYQKQDNNKMALIEIPRTQIRVPLTDRIFNDTVIKQEAVFVSLRHDQLKGDGVCSVNVTVVVKYYANDNGAFGTHLHDKGMMDKRFDLVADNNCAVDAANGDILAVKGMRTSPAEWQAELDALEADYILQGDYFMIGRDTSAIEIGNLIRHHIQQADAMAKFA